MAYQNLLLAENQYEQAVKAKYLKEQSLETAREKTGGRASERQQPGVSRKRLRDGGIVETDSLFPASFCQTGIRLGSGRTGSSILMIFEKSEEECFIEEKAKNTKTNG